MGDADYSLTTFSPSGKLVQIEYALNQVSSGRPALGIKAKNGVVLATEKVSTPLTDASSLKKIANVTDSCGAVFAGMMPDFRMILHKTQKSATKYYGVYKDQIPTLQLVKETAGLMQEFTQSGGVRPMGCSLMIAGWDDDGPMLYQVDPSGAYFGWKASAIGKNYVNAKTFLEKRYHADIELEDAIHVAILTLQEGFEGSFTEENIEIGVIGQDRKFKVLTKEQVKDYLSEVD